jgi:hypothetical protein
MREGKFEAAENPRIVLLGITAVKTKRLAQ